MRAESITWKSGEPPMLTENSSISSRSQSGLEEFPNTINLLAPEAKLRIKQLAYEYPRSNPAVSTKRSRAIMSTVLANRLLGVKKLRENAVLHRK